jgi:hypothetical protein
LAKVSADNDTAAAGEHSSVYSYSVLSGRTGTRLWTEDYLKKTFDRIFFIEIKKYYKLYCSLKGENSVERAQNDNFVLKKFWVNVLLTIFSLH